MRPQAPRHPPPLLRGLRPRPGQDRPGLIAGERSNHHHDGQLGRSAWWLDPRICMPKAKRVIYLFMAGAPSQLDLFDHKPALLKYDGQARPCRGRERPALCVHPARRQPDGLAVQVRQAWEIRARTLRDAAASGQGGRRHRRRQVGAHRPVQPRSRPDLHQHRLLASRSTEHGLVGDVWPRFRGADLPGFVVLSSAGGISGGAANWSCGFLPAAYQGVPFRSKGDPILNVASPRGRSQAPARHDRPRSRAQHPPPGERGRPRDRSPDRLV